METERRQFRKSGDSLAGRGSSDAEAFGLILSEYACTQIYMWCVREETELRQQNWRGDKAGGRVGSWRKG